MLSTRAEVFEMLGISETANDQDRAIFQLVHRPAEASLMSWLNRESADYKQRVEYLPQQGRRRGETDLALADVERIGDTVQLTPFGPAPRTLQLAHRPVWNVGIEVREDTAANAGQGTNAFAAGTILTAGTDYWLDATTEATANDGTEDTIISETGLLIRATSWPSEPRSVKVTYWGGETVARLADQHANLKYAAILTVMTAFRTVEEIQNGTDGATSETLGKYSYGRGGGTALLYSPAQFSVPPEAQRAAMPAKNFRLWG